MEKVEPWYGITTTLIIGFAIITALFSAHFFVAILNKRDNKRLRAELEKRDREQAETNEKLRNKINETNDLFLNEATKLLNSIQDVIKKD